MILRKIGVHMSTSSRIRAEWFKGVSYGIGNGRGHGGGNSLEILTIGGRRAEGPSPI